jgi:thymidylate synthase
MQKYQTYVEAEQDLIQRIIKDYDFMTRTTYERIGEGFVLIHPLVNQNSRSNYEYAEAFFEWLISGQKQLSKRLLDINPWVGRFTAEDGLPPNFSASYGWKIKKQLQGVIEELKGIEGSRRGYISILFDEDSIIRTIKTTHEYPCTIGLHFLMRDGLLHLIANMRSNNCIKVMPYDVYNFTMLQKHVSDILMIPVGYYYHQINSAHVFKGDARRWIEQNPYLPSL